MDSTLVPDVMIAVMIPFTIGSLLPMLGLSMAVTMMVVLLTGGSFIGLRLLQIKQGRERDIN
ncbi:MAG: hypothetical protein ACOCYT_02560 [Chloroflexota bacterium]